MNKQGPNKISYLDYTWNPVTGCKHGCSYCWAEKTYSRFHLDFTPKFHPDKLEEPLRVKKPARIGVVFSGDLWGDWVPREWIIEVLNICWQAPQHRFLFLTKNPAHYAEFVEAMPKNCWCGTSTTGDKAGAERLVELENSAPHGRLFTSLEPWTPSEGHWLIAGMEKTNWLIVGGLTGRGARKPYPEHLKLVVDYAHKRSIPVYVKSNAGYPGAPQEFPEWLRL